MNGPGFFIVGAPKCGTTALYDYLNQHPEIFLSPVKEPAFFGRDMGLLPAASTERNYLRLFKGAGNRMAGEASTHYLSSAEAAEEIRAFQPDARIIIMLRDPVDFVASYHNQQLFNDNEEVTDPRTAWELIGPRRRGEQLPRHCERPQALDYERMAMFSVQVERYLNRFDRDRVHIILFDEFKAETRQVVQQVYRFLGCDPSYEPTLEPKNASKTVRNRLFQRLIVNPRLRTAGKKVIPEIWASRFGAAMCRWNTRPNPRPPMEPGLRRQLITHFRPDVQRLGRLIERDLSAWAGETGKSHAEAAASPEADATESYTTRS